MQGNYSVRIEGFAERHFIKSFEKKHKIHWDITLRAVIAELERIDTLLLTGRAETICDAGDIKIIKTKFRVAGTRESAKISANRCIVAWHKDRQFVAVLLVYAKTDINGDKETAQWQKLVKENYTEYRAILQ